MTIVCEIAFVAAAPIPSAPTGPAAEFIRHLAGLPELVSLDLYTPARDETADPYVRNGAAPALLAMLTFPSLDALDRAARHDRFGAGLAGMSTGVLTCTAMRRTDHAIAGADAPTAFSAPFSYVVRYHRPAQDEARFVQHYVETHPPLLSRLPGIRNVMCYLPLPWRHAGGVPVADYMLGMRWCSTMSPPSMRPWRRRFDTSCARISASSRPSPAGTRISPWIAGVRQAELLRLAPKGQTALASKSPNGTEQTAPKGR
jgi:hypothetical protein